MYYRTITPVVKIARSSWLCSSMIVQNSVHPTYRNKWNIASPILEFEMVLPHKSETIMGVFKFGFTSINGHAPGVVLILGQVFTTGLHSMYLKQNWKVLMKALWYKTIDTLFPGFIYLIQNFTNTTAVHYSFLICRVLWRRWLSISKLELHQMKTRTKA